MKTEEAVNAQLQQVVQKRATVAHNDILRQQLMTLKKEAQRFIEHIEDYQARKYTGEYVLLAKNNKGKWTCLGIIDPDDERWESEELPPFTLILPIPEPETMPEFDGF